MKALVLPLLLLPCALKAQYFQQQVDYTIGVRLDDERHILHGQESFVYSNNSPQALDTLWIHLWPNAYTTRGTALCEQMNRTGDLSLHFAKDAERGTIDSLDFMVNGVKAPWGYHARHIDIAWLKLPAPVQPGGRVTISTPFRVKIPDGKFSRLGHSDQAYYITQWYPKPAVYDATGWHAMPYLTQGEFYSEFGSFDVSITLPENYVVGATGLLQDARERAWMDSLAAAPYEETQKFFLDKQRVKLNTIPPSAAESKSIRFTQDRVHDFAWFADKRFIVRKSRVTLPRSGRDVTTWALFTPKNALLWSDAVSYVDESVRFYSEHVGDYPYDACTAIDGTISAGGGMEYPMITVIGNMPDKQSLDNVIAHEVGHNWFYGILGSNERDHAWMDEGMNSFLELRYMRQRYPASGFSIGIPGLKKAAAHLSDPHRSQNELAYRLNARRNLDQPLSLSSDDFTSMNYGTGVYMKTALVMDHMMAYLGEEMMDKCLRAYFEEWKFKHPGPKDMKAVFERESGQDLNWVFEGLLMTDEKYRVKAASLDKRTWVGATERWHLGHRAKGPSKVPFAITGYLEKDSLGTVWAWNHGFGHQGRTEYAGLPWPNVDRVRIDAGNRTLDIDRRNNTVRGHGLFKRCAAPSFEHLFGLERNDRPSLYWSLLPNWNQHDGWQAGISLRNTTFPNQRTEWVMAPLYSFLNDRVSGTARIEHHFDRIRSSWFRNIHLGFGVRSSGLFQDHKAQAWYEKYSPSVRIDVKRPLAKPWAHSVNLRGARIYTTSELIGSDDVVYRYRTFDDYLELTHTAADERKLRPSSIRTALTAGEDWLRGAIEVKQAFAYDARGKQLRLRAFGGSFLTGGENVFGLEALNLSWGPEDLLYDHAYFDRGRYHTGFFGRQFNKQQGAFKTPFRGGGSDSWIASVNAELDMPFKLPLALFGSIGWAPYTQVNADGTRSLETATYAEAGIGLTLLKDILEVWMPIYVSDRILEEEEFAGRTFGDRIRFVFALEKLDPTRIVRAINP
ncbi:MAG: M1 family metallopeptidase [Flavobacteriales bacterium]|nr:M1 family metallopeptidase [Flavobacteriales bacterium]